MRSKSQNFHSRFKPYMDIYFCISDIPQYTNLGNLPIDRAFETSAASLCIILSLSFSQEANGKDANKVVLVDHPRAEWILYYGSAHLSHASTDHSIESLVAINMDCK